jgi:hypothetical protein
MGIMGLGMDRRRDIDGAMDRGIEDTVLAPDPVVTDRSRGIDSEAVGEDMETAIGDDALGLALYAIQSRSLPQMMRKSTP